MSSLLATAVVSLARAPYRGAGAATGLAQGYVLILAELCHAIGFRTLEAELRKLLPSRGGGSGSGSGVDSSSTIESLPQSPPRNAVAAAAHAPLQDEQQQLPPPGGVLSSGSFAVLDLDALGTAVHTMATPDELTSGGGGTNTLRNRVDDAAAAATTAPRDSAPAKPPTTSTAPPPPPPVDGGTCPPPATPTATMQPPTLAPLLLLHGDSHDSGNGLHEPQQQQLLQLQEEEEAEPQEAEEAAAACAAASGGGDVAQPATDEQPQVVVDMSLVFHSVASFPLDHVSEPTTAHTTASHLHPASYAQFVLGQEGQAQEEGGLDLAVGPLEPVEGEMDVVVTNSTGSNLLSPTDWDGGAVGSLAASAAAAAAALVVATSNDASHVASFGDDDTAPRADTGAKPDQAARATGDKGAATAAAAAVGAAAAGVRDATTTTSSSSASGSRRDTVRVGRPAQRHVSRVSDSSSSHSSPPAVSPRALPLPVPQQEGGSSRGLRKVSFSNELAGAEASGLAPAPGGAAGDGSKAAVQQREGRGGVVAAIKKAFEIKKAFFEKAKQTRADKRAAKKQQGGGGAGGPPLQ